MSEKQVEVNIYPNPKLFVMTTVKQMASEESKAKRHIQGLLIFEALQEMINRSDIEESEDGRSVIL